jgi:hypothetical protein
MSRVSHGNTALAVMILTLLGASPAIADGSASGDFPERTFSMTRSTPGDPFTVEILPQTTGEWWVTADVVAGAFITVSLWRDDAGSLVLESTSRLHNPGDESTRTLLTSGASYRATFTQVGKQGTSVLRERFSWVRQFDTPTAIYDIAVDGSFIYATGREGGAYLRKFDAEGVEVWTRPLLGGYFGVALAIDGTGVYVTGIGPLIPGEAGLRFLRKYDFDGNEQWTEQIDSGPNDFGGVAADGTGVYIAGATSGTLPGQSSAGDYDAYLRKYDPAGHEIWTRQFGTSASDAVAISLHAGPSGVYVVGETFGVLAGGSNAGGRDGFVSKFDSEGNEAWTRQFGAGGDDRPSSVVVDATGVYVVGSTQTSETAFTHTDAFVRKFDLDGNETWSRQFGSDSPFLYTYDEAFAVDADDTGVYVGGWTDGSLPGQTSFGPPDSFVRKYDPEGNEIWTRQFGTAGYDVLHDVAIRRDGDEALGVYVAGEKFLGLLLP